MRIVQKYIIREILQPFGAVLVVLILIYLTNRFIDLLADAAAGTLSRALIFELLALKLLGKSALLLPLALYAAVLLGLGRLYKDSEMTAMVAGGIGLGAVVRAVLVLALLTGAIVSVLALYVSPKVAGMQADLLAQAKEESEITGIYPGRFRVFRDGKQTVYAEEIAPDGRRLHKIFVVSRTQEREHVLVARHAYQKLQGNAGQRYIVLEHGRRYSGTPGQQDYVVTRFDRHAVLLEVGHAEPAFKKHDVFTTMELINSGQRNLKAELQRRISTPISVILLSLLAISLAQTSPRQGKYAKLFTAFLIYFAYNNAISVFGKLVTRGDVHHFIGVWPVHGVMAIVVILLLMKQTKCSGYFHQFFRHMFGARRYSL